MNRTVLGAFATLLLLAAGLFWWQGRAATEKGAPLPVLADDASVGALPDELPSADGRGLRGAAPPEADEASREEKRFNRLDRDRDNRITRNEMLAPRTPTFRKLDTDGNNLLSFEEWSVKTSNRFKGADGNGDGALTRQEYATTRPHPAAQPQCRCSPIRNAARRPAPPPSDSDEGEPEP